MKPLDTTRNRPALLSDHPVLEFLNTRSMVEGKLQDRLQTDTDVLSTLNRLGWPIQWSGAGLLAAARSLREELRELVESRKSGKPLNLAKLNRFLGEARSHLTLGQDRKGSFVVDRVWECGTPQQALAPMAESAADMLANGDFKLIRQCESEACVLWFYDRTRSHQRRWCSMASCGNRHKVATFRKRRSQA